jgi:hypothetical protein
VCLGICCEILRYGIVSEILLEFVTGLCWLSRTCHSVVQCGVVQCGVVHCSAV